MFLKRLELSYEVASHPGWVAEPEDFTSVWADLREDSAHCFSLVWETEHLRKLNKSLLAFLASAVRSSPATCHPGLELDLLSTFMGVFCCALKRDRHCVLLVWETRTSRKLNTMLLAFLVSIVL